MPCHAVAGVVSRLRQPNLWLPQSPISKPPCQSLCPCRRQPGASLSRSRPPAQPVPPASDIYPRSAALMCPAAHRRERQRETNPLPAKWSKSPKRYKWRTLCPTAPRPMSIFPAADVHVSSTAARTGHGRGRWGGRGSHLLCLFLQRLASLPIAATATHRHPSTPPLPSTPKEKGALEGACSRVLQLRQLDEGVCDAMHKCRESAWKWASLCC